MPATRLVTVPDNLGGIKTSSVQSKGIPDFFGQLGTIVGNTVTNLARTAGVGIQNGFEEFVQSQLDGDTAADTSKPKSSEVPVDGVRTAQTAKSPGGIDPLYLVGGAVALVGLVVAFRK